MSAVLKFKDDNDGNDKLISVIIEPASNGFIVTFSYEESGEYRKVFNSKADMLKEIGAVL